VQIGHHSTNIFRRINFKGSSASASQHQ
jgi:hypothetical protein